MLFAKSAQRPPVDAIMGSYLREKKSPYIHLSWMIHGQCNYRCSYCHKNNWGGSSRRLEFNHAISFLERFLEHYKDRRIVVSFSGGEPTLWPHFAELVQWLHLRGISMGLTSNGSRGPSYFKKLAPLLSWINLSYHPEFSHEQRFMETVIGASFFCDVRVRLMMPVERRLWDRSISFGEKLKSALGYGSLITIEYAPISEEFSGLHARPSAYETDQKARFEEPTFVTGLDRKFTESPSIENVDGGVVGPPKDIFRLDVNGLLALGQTNFMGWKCEVGLEQIFIDSEGSVLRAGCRVGGTIGHITNAKMEFPTKAVLCPKTYCYCGTDVIATKLSPKWILNHDLESVSQGFKAPVYRWAAYLRYSYAQVIPRIVYVLKFFVWPWTVSVIRSTLGPRLTRALRFKVWPWISDSWKSLIYSRRLRKPYFFLRYQFRTRWLG
jgi:hypothetical protein